LKVSTLPHILLRWAEKISVSSSGWEVVPMIWLTIRCDFSVSWLRLWRLHWLHVHDCGASLNVRALDPVQEVALIDKLNIQTTLLLASEGLKITPS